MINQIVKFNVQPKHSEAFKAALIEDKKNAGQDSGLVEMRLFVDNDKPNVFFGYERWEDQVSIDKCREQPCTKKIGELINTVLESPIKVLDLGETMPAPVPVDDQKKPNPEDDVFVIFFIFKIKDGYRERLIQRFEEHITQTRKEEGCILFDLYTIEGADDTLVVYEHWRNESAVWDIHLKQPYSKVTGALMTEAVVGDMEKYMNFVTELA